MSGVPKITALELATWITEVDIERLQDYLGYSHDHVMNTLFLVREAIECFAIHYDD